MKRKSLLLAICVGVGLWGIARADYGLKTVPSWRAQSAKKFTVEDGIARADGVPFPLIMDFTWSAPHDQEFFRYDVQLLTTAHYAGFGLRLEAPQDWSSLDSMLALCQRNRIYLVVGLHVQNQDGYTSRHPDARMVGPGGAKLSRDYACFMHPGYREALGKALADLGRYLRDKPYVLGYYPQDEFSYPGLGGYSESCLKVFRERILKKYGNLAGLNAAWKTNFATAQEISPPEKIEATVRWADWQEFRRWAYFDFASFVYRALKENDPNHLVIWSLDFWGSATSVSNWWRMSECSDVLMRHGIGYQGGAFRFQLVREIAEWGKKPGSALAMPPGYYAPYEQFSLLLDASRTGVSYVCAGGGDEHLYYRGAADSDRGYKRREPGYTTARSFNQLVHLLGETYLLSKRRAPQVGFFIGDRTSWITGISHNHVNGILNLLGDINADFQIVSENNLGDPRRFRVLIIGPAIRLASDDIVSKILAFVRAGGGLILMPGAFDCDENGVPAPRDIMAFFEKDQVPAKNIAIGKHTIELDRRATVQPLLKSAGGEVVASTPDGIPVGGKIKLGNGEILAFGWDVGTPYAAAWTNDFAGVGEKEDIDAVEENAYANMRPERIFEGAVALKPQRAVAVLFREFMRAHGARETVRCEGYTDAVAALRCRSFRQGNHYLIGIANRMVKPRKKFAETWPADYHIPLENLHVSVRLDEPSQRLCAVRMPLARPEKDGWNAMPELLSVRASPEGEEIRAQFTLPRLHDAAMIILSPDYQPVMGAATTHRAVPVGETLTFTARIVNPGIAPVSGELFAEVDGEGLSLLGENGKSFSIASGASFDTGFRIKVPETAKPGHYLVQGVARLKDGRLVRSPSLEVEVMPLFDISISPGDQTIYPDHKVGKDVTVAVRPFSRAIRGKLTLSLDGAPSFAPDARQKEVRLDGMREEYLVTFTFAVPKQEHITELAELMIAGEVGGLKVQRSERVRLARGTVVYREERTVRLSNASPNASRENLVVLENPHIKVRLIPKTAVVHDLVLRETNNDLLFEGMYPFGLVWYGWKGGWELKEISQSGPEVRAAFASLAPDGKPVTMTAVLRDGESHCTVTYDASAAGPVKQNFYLMSRLGKSGTYIANVICIPTHKGMLRRPWKKPEAFLTIPAADLAEPWMAVTDERNGQVFSVSFHFDHLDHVNVSAGSSNFNYMIFQPKADLPPGKIIFRLAGQKGGLEDAQALQRALIEKR